MARVSTRLATKPIKKVTPKPETYGNGHAPISDETALLVVDPVAAAGADQPTIKVKSFDFSAKGSLFGFIELSEAQFSLNDAIAANDSRAMVKGLRLLIDALRPYLEPEPGTDIDVELRRLSFDDLFALANSIKSGVPLPNENGAPSTTGQKGRARRHRG